MGQLPYLKTVMRRDYVFLFKKPAYLPFGDGRSHLSRHAVVMLSFVTGKNKCWASFRAEFPVGRSSGRISK